MQRFFFKKGLEFLVLSGRWTLIRRHFTGKLQFESDSGEIKSITENDFYQLWMAGEWVLVIESLGVSNDAIYSATPRDLSTFPEKWQLRAIRRLQYIEGIDPENNKYNVDIWRSLIKELALKMNDQNPPCPSSVHLWWSRFKVDKSVLSVIPRTVTTLRNTKPAAYALFEEVIAKVYLTRQQKPKLEVVKTLWETIERINQGRDSPQHIKRPARSSIYRWLNELQQDLVDGARLGAEATRAKYRIAMVGLKVAGPLERIEIDNHLLDLIVIDKESGLPLGRPWLTLAIDKHTRMIFGFYISFNTPSSHSILMCLKQGILPKVEVLERFPDIKGEWPIHGIPVLIAVDNGMDLHSKAYAKTSQELGIQILYCPAKLPEAKASIERFFRTQNQGLIHMVPGTVFSNITERGDYPAEEAAVIDMEDLTYLVTKWIVDIYSVSYHRGISTSPLLKWHQSAKNLMIDLPVYPQQLEVITGIPANRTIFHYGIELEGLHYNSKPLQEMRRRTGENIKVQLKFFMDSIAYVQVYDDKNREYIRVDCVNDDYASDLSRYTHRLVREHARLNFNDNFSFVHLMEARQQIEDRINIATKNKKMSNRKFGAGYLKHDSDSIFDTKDPLAKAKKPIKSDKDTPPEDLPKGLEDELPKFDFKGLPSLDLNDGTDDIDDEDPK